MNEKKITLKILSMKSSLNSSAVGLKPMYISKENLVLPADAEKLMLTWSTIVEKANSKTSRAIHKVSKGIGKLFKGKKEEKNFDEVEDLKISKRDIVSRGSISKIAEQATKRFYQVYNFFFGKDSIEKVPDNIKKAKETIDKYCKSISITNNIDAVLKALKCKKSDISYIQGIKNDITFGELLDAVFESVIKNETTLGHKCTELDLDTCLYESCNDILKKVDEKYHSINKNYILGTYFGKQTSPEITTLEQKIESNLKSFRKNLETIENSTNNLCSERDKRIPQKILQKINNGDSWYKERYQTDINEIFSIPDKIKEKLKISEETSKSYKLVVKYGAELNTEKLKSDKPNNTVNGVLEGFVMSIDRLKKISESLYKSFTTKYIFNQIIKQLKSYFDNAIAMNKAYINMCDVIKEYCTVQTNSQKNNSQDTKLLESRKQQLQKVQQGMKTLDEKYINEINNFNNNFRNIIQSIENKYANENNIMVWYDYLDKKLSSLQATLNKVKTAINTINIFSS